MVEYTAEVTLRTARALTEDALFEAAELGGVAVGKVGGRLIEATMTISKARDVRHAADLAIEALKSRVSGTVVAVEVMTTAEADRRAAEKPRLVGISEIAAMLKLSKQRVSTLRQREDFPKPIADLASGPVWREGDLSTFAAGWQRKPGRPRKDVEERRGVNRLADLHTEK